MQLQRVRLGAVMTYVPGFEYDIFISYPRENNRQDPQGLQWVREFHRCLQTALNQRIPSKEQPKIFFDDQDFQGGQSIEMMLEAARQSALFVAVVSPAYVAPGKFTLKELNAFCEARRARHFNDLPILSIYFLPVEERYCPPELRRPKRIEFFLINENQVEVPLSLRHDDYISKIHTVAQHVKNRLEEIKLKRSEERPPLPSGKKVLLSQVTDDLVDIREEFREYMEKLGAIVMPRSEYPEWGPQFMTEFRRNLAEADLFVQLLSKVRSPQHGDEPSCARFQYEAAKSAHKQTIQWRDLSDISKVPSHYDKALLEDAQSMSLEQCKVTIRAMLNELSRPGGAPTDHFIYITASNEDLEPALELKKIGNTRGAVRIMEDEGKLRDFKKQIRRSKAVVFLYGKAPRRFVDLWLDKYSQEKGKLSSPPQIEAVYFAPPPKNQAEHKLRTGWRGLRELGSQETFDPEEILRIFAELDGGRTR
jgi:hypothetical protein